ncbi:MAG: hypothetical protein WA432_00560 [Candidatus Babeliaceae bacterium]
MIKKDFSIKEAFSFAIHNFFDNIGQIVLAMVVSLLEILGIIFLFGVVGIISTMFISSDVSSIFFSFSLKSFSFSSFVHGIRTLIEGMGMLGIIVCILSGLFLYGIISSLYFVRLNRIVLDIYEEGKTSVKSWWHIHYILWRAIPAAWLFSIYFSIGFILFVIPGLYVLAVWGLYNYIIVDSKLGPLAAFRRSAELTHDVRMKLLGFYVIEWFVMSIPLIGFLLGRPFCQLAGAHIYRKLIEQSK